MKDILTPGQVRVFRDFHVTGLKQEGYVPSAPRVADSHEGLREQLVEAEEDVRALAQAVTLFEGYDELDFMPKGSDAVIKAALARPGVQRVMEETP